MLVLSPLGDILFIVSVYIKFWKINYVLVYLIYLANDTYNIYLNIQYKHAIKLYSKLK